MKIDEKLETLQRLVKVPNVDDNPEESLRAMKMLNLIVDIRLELQLLQPADATEGKLCGSLEPDNTTSSATICKHCGREKLHHQHNKL